MSKTELTFGEKTAEKRDLCNGNKKILGWKK